MKVDKKELALQRVEIIKKAYDSKGRIIEEKYEYYFPKTELQEVGFKK